MSRREPQIYPPLTPSAMPSVDATALVTVLQDAFPAAGLEPAPTIDLQETFYVSREHAPEVLRALRDRGDLRFVLLSRRLAAIRSDTAIVRMLAESSTSNRE